MANIWTDNQRLAINARGGSLIVSAAAGAGKTSVLVERVIKRITDKENPIDADRILVVTYTRAAAQELKERLSNKISQLISEDPSNRYLRRQQLLLSKANISTIDSFCSSVVKEFFYILNIDRNFRIGDTGELNIIKNDALSLTLDSMYAKGEPDFFNLVEAFSGTKDDSLLQKNILKIHEFLMSHPFMDKWISEKLKIFESFDDVSDSKWGRIIFDYATEACDYLIVLCNSSLDCISTDEKLYKSLYPLFNSELEFATALKEKLQSGSWQDISQHLSSVSYQKMVVPKGYKDDPNKEKAAANRKLFKAIVENLSEMFSFDSTVCKKDIADLRVLSEQLFYCVKAFSDNYQNLKRMKKLADYSDLEHWTLKLLVNEADGSYTDIALQLRSRFDEIMVDEYQDANKVQDTIFNAISNSKNLFFVGDVKQSIYGFRQAMPQLFLDRKNNSYLYSEEKTQFPAKIILDKNFRSAKVITDAVNYFFRKLMSLSVGDIVYNDEERLVYGADYDKDISKPGVDVHMIDLAAVGEEDPCVAEAKYIAQLIHKMVHKDHYKVKDGDTYRNAEYRDFAVLMRNANKHAPTYVQVLNSLGIPANCESTPSFLQSQEIKVMTSLLSVIDNPCMDIELLTVMMSPIFGFTVDDLAFIRSDSRKDPLYLSVKKSADNGDIKCKDFVAELKYYRDISATMPISTLINTIYERTCFDTLSSVLYSSETSLNNLRLLSQYAKSYESSTNSGLSHFVSYLHRLLDTDNDLASAVDIKSSAYAGVQVMSIHKSKGLEFPICIIANTSRKLVSDSSESVILNSDLGIAVKRVDKALGATYNTMPRKALSLETVRAEKSEELRVLYVAMTRAKQKLIMLSSPKDAEKYLKNISAKLSGGTSLSPFVVRDAARFSDWIVMCAMLHPNGKKLRDYCGLDIEHDSSTDFEMNCEVVTSLLSDTNTTQTDENSEGVTFDSDDSIIEALKRTSSFEYKNSALTKLPMKIAASELSHKMTDSNLERLLDTPAFLNDKKLTPAGRGTALHAFMQFCDFSLARKDIKSEIIRLKDSGFISEAQADSIDISKAEAFINSDIVSRCLNSEKVFKEYRFTIKVDASMLDSSIDSEKDSEKIVLQGAVDLAFLEDGELVIVDYKTDNVKDASELYPMYHTQLEIYAAAMNECTEYSVKQCLIYSIKHNKYVQVQL